MRALMLLGPLPPAGLQTVLPSYLRERFVAAALSYIACGSAGELVCRRSDCRCQCQPAFPRCNCPEADIQALESSLAQLGRAWESHHSQFEESGEAGETPASVSFPLRAARAACCVSGAGSSPHEDLGARVEGGCFQLHLHRLLSGVR